MHTHVILDAWVRSGVVVASLIRASTHPGIETRWWLLLHSETIGPAPATSDDRISINKETTRICTR